MKAHQLIQRWVAIVTLPLGAQAGLAQDIPLAVVPDSSRISLQLNIPAYRLDVHQDGRLVRSFTVAVGMRQYATPVGDFAITSIVWNPTWYPPPSGWAKNETVTPPGPSNPMGRVKLAIGNAYYLHGTPAVNSLGKAASHGCVRMHNDDVSALAQMIENEPGALPPGVSPTVPPRSWSPSRTVKLARPVPVRIVYHLAEVRGEELVIHGDVYRRATDGMRPHIIDALQRANIDSGSIPIDTLLQQVATTKARPIRIPLGEVRATGVEGELMYQSETEGACPLMFPATR